MGFLIEQDGSLQKSVEIAAEIASLFEYKNGLELMINVIKLLTITSTASMIVRPKN